MLSILCVRLTIKVKVGIPESFKVGWYPRKKTGSSHLKVTLFWFLISKRNIQVHQKDTLDFAIHSSYLKALKDGGCLRLNQVLSREFKVKSPP